MGSPSNSDPASCEPGPFPKREPWPHNYAVCVEYDGTDFSGWQRQKPGLRTVQGELEIALAKIFVERVNVQGAGRTDSGVHAHGQVAHFGALQAIPAIGLRRGLNAVLPSDIAIRGAALVDTEFCARRTALGKRYCYRVWNQEDRSALYGRYTWYQRKPLDLDAMRLACMPLVGEHDFVAFRAADCDRKTTVRRIDRLEIRSLPEHPSLVEIVVEGNAFLRNMVRIIAGTLVGVGRHQKTPAQVAEALESKRRELAGVTAPPQGLRLDEVFYPSLQFL